MKNLVPQTLLDSEKKSGIFEGVFGKQLAKTWRGQTNREREKTHKSPWPPHLNRNKRGGVGKTKQSQGNKDGVGAENRDSRGWKREPLLGYYED